MKLLWLLVAVLAANTEGFVLIDNNGNEIEPQQDTVPLSESPALITLITVVKNEIKSTVCENDCDDTSVLDSGSKVQMFHLQRFDYINRRQFKDSDKTFLRIIAEVNADFLPIVYSLEERPPQLPNSVYLGYKLGKLFLFQVLDKIAQIKATECQVDSEGNLVVGRNLKLQDRSALVKHFGLRHFPRHIGVQSALGVSQLCEVPAQNLKTTIEIAQKEFADILFKDTTARIEHIGKLKKCTAVAKLHTSHKHHPRIVYLLRQSVENKQTYIVNGYLFINAFGYLQEFDYSIVELAEVINKKRSMDLARLKPQIASLSTVFSEFLVT